MPDTMTLNPAMLRDALLSQHPWYATMIADKNEWQLARAVTGRFSDDDVKRQFLTSGEFEPPAQYATRVAMSQFEGATDVICSSFAGAVFSQEVAVDFAGNSDLEKWSENVDGMGTSIGEMLAYDADESIPMGLVGYFVDLPMRSAEDQARIDATPTDVRSPDGAVPRDIAGTPQPRVVKFSAENIVDFDVDKDGRLEWLKLVHEVSRSPDPFAPRQDVVQFTYLTRTQSIVFEADAIVPITAPNVVDPQEKQMATTGLRFPISSQHIGEIRGPVISTHNLGVVPFVTYYGGGKKLGPLQARSLLEGTKRADLSHFNRSSWFTYSLYVHGVPVQWLKLSGDRAANIGEVIKGFSRLVVLNSEKGEDTGYATTDASAFQTYMEAVAEQKTEAFAQAGADPGNVAQDASPESGRAKQVRFRNTEARSLSRIAKDAEDAHYGLLEVASRYFMPVAPPIDQRAFGGTVRYPTRFDLADAKELIDNFNSSRNAINSPTFERIMRERMAARQVGEVGIEDQRAITDEIATSESIIPPPPVFGAPGADPNSPDAMPGDSMKFKPGQPKPGKSPPKPKE